MKFWLSVLFFLAEGALLIFGMIKAVGTATTPSNFLPLIRKVRLYRQCSEARALKRISHADLAGRSMGRGFRGLFRDKNGP
jgi:hypothetical protein